MFSKSKSSEKKLKLSQDALDKLIETQKDQQQILEKITQQPCIKLDYSKLFALDKTTIAKPIPPCAIVISQTIPYLPKQQLLNKQSLFLEDSNSEKTEKLLEEQPLRLKS